MGTYIELFAGWGGLSYGLEEAGLKAHTLIELDKNCVKTLKKNFNSSINIVNKDVRDVDFTIYKDCKIDLVVGGVPCQSFSSAGKREGLENKDKGGMFNDFFSCLKDIEPLMFVVENVEGLKNINSGQTLKFLITRFENMGYTVDYKILNAVNYDVPQKRKRLIIVGTKYGVSFEWPKPSKTILTMKDALTLTTSPQQKQTERCHPDETRPLKIREYTRIQTFPDTFEFEGAMGTVYRQIGNAVPCKLAYHIGKQIIKCLEQIKKVKSVESIKIEPTKIVKKSNTKNKKIPTDKKEKTIKVKKTIIVKKN